MNFNAFFLKSFRVLLLPFAVLYGAIVFIRNRLYDKGIILQETSFNFPLICVGNIAVGGTGKSPMVEYLLNQLQPKYKIATLSRGYKRKTKGYALANEQTTALEIGDEPMQFYLKFPDVPVAVGEERLVAIPQLLHDVPDLQAIILDDAFQHRAVKAGLNIVLTEYNNLYIYDFFLPTGDLRDEWRSVKRADIIIITKCPNDLSVEKKQKLLRNLHPLPKQQVYFTTIEYGSINHSLLTAMVCKQYNLPVIGWVFNDHYLHYEQEIVNWSGFPYIGSIPFTEQPNRQFVQEQATKIKERLIELL